MKIRKVDTELQLKALAMLRDVFPRSKDEIQLVERLYSKKRDIQSWVCIHTNKVIAHVVFSNAYNGSVLCGLHLASLAVKPEFQKHGVGSELLRFALRQEGIKKQALFVLGKPKFYKKFGFEPCANPICPFDKNNKNFLSIRNPVAAEYTVGYEPEFRKGG